MGSGHGFVSSSIRFNTPADEWANLHDIWPGGSRILVDLCPQAGDEEHAGAAFYVKRSGAPRISSVAFENFCIDGLHFIDDGLGNNDPENSYTNGKTGIYIASAQDAFRITGWDSSILSMASPRTIAMLWRSIITLLPNAVTVLSFVAPGRLQK
jgi:inulin fructotransferase (DFA-I-forming)